MDWKEYNRLVSQLGYGKILPGAIYVHRDFEPPETTAVSPLIARLVEYYKIGEQFNVVKFRSDAPRLSFLTYPGFFEIAHPALESVMAIDLASGRVHEIEYRDDLNAPILHRKELLLPPGHPRIPEFAALSAAEERAGLFENTSTIGFRMNWDRLLAARRVAIDGHTLVELDDRANPLQSTERPAIHRHKTALYRTSLSKPVKSVIDTDQLLPGFSFFDYGCGMGADVRGLAEMGITARGWDPVYAPAEEKTPSDVVNLGYVLNVIEDPVERVETLVQAWGLAKQLLVVSTLVGDSSHVEATKYGDGVLTKRQTFQKLFSQREFQLFLEDALETTAIPVSLGLFYLFRDPERQQLFLEARSRRHINWTESSISFRKLAPPGETRRTKKRDRYSEHPALIEDFWSCAVGLGRAPLPSEFSRYQELETAVGPPTRVLAYLQRTGRGELFAKSRAARRSDLLVYLACAGLRKPIPYGNLPDSLRHDMEVFFGTYKRGLHEGEQLLHSAADVNTIVLACDDASIGWQDQESLLVAASMIDQLPVVLRVYVACAELLFGDATQADVVKLHKLTGKITFLCHTEFQTDLLPVLVTRTKVNLRTSRVDVYDHSSSHQPLYFKERYLAPEHPQRQVLVELSSILHDFGVPESGLMGPTATQLGEMIASRGAGDRSQLLSAVVKELTHDRT